VPNKGHSLAISAAAITCPFSLCFGPSLQLGCGAGNTVYPLLAQDPKGLFVHCCDFSLRAIDLVKVRFLLPVTLPLLTVTSSWIVILWMVTDV